MLDLGISLYNDKDLVDADIILKRDKRSAEKIVDDIWSKPVNDEPIEQIAKIKAGIKINKYFETFLALYEIREESEQYKGVLDRVLGVVVGCAFGEYFDQLSELFALAERQVNMLAATDIILQDDRVLLINDTKWRRNQFRNAFIQLSNEISWFEEEVTGEVEEAVLRNTELTPINPISTEVYPSSSLTQSPRLSADTETMRAARRVEGLLTGIASRIGARVHIVCIGQNLIQRIGVEVPVSLIGLLDDGLPVLIERSEFANFDSVGRCVMRLLSALEWLQNVDIRELSTLQREAMENAVDVFTSRYIIGDFPEVTWNLARGRLREQSALLVLVVNDTLPQPVISFLEWMTRHVGPARLIWVRV